MKNLIPVLVVGALGAGVCAAADIARIELHLVETTTLTDEEFLTGTRGVTRATIAGELRLPRGQTPRFPAVIFANGSSGFIAKDDRWVRELNDAGVATFLVDSFTGRSIADSVSNQSVLSSLTMMNDAFRALEVLARHPRIDSARVAVFGGSKGGVAALYSAVRRFQRMYAPANLQFAAHIVFYPPCGRTFVGDGDVVDRPIRIFHGTADEVTPIAPCREYVGRLRAAGKDVTLIEYADARHGFDNPGPPLTLIPVPAGGGGSTAHCDLVEEPVGRIVHRDTKRPFAPADACATRGKPAVGYSADAHAAATSAVLAMLREALSLSTPMGADAAPSGGTSAQP